MTTLQGKNAIITGGTRGIGLAIARGFLQSGATVTICSRKQKSIDAALSELSEHDESLQAVAAHVGRLEDLNRLVTACEDRFGAIDVLVNNAGTNPYYGPIVD